MWCCDNVKILVNGRMLVFVSSVFQVISELRANLNFTSSMLPPTACSTPAEQRRSCGGYKCLLTTKRIICELQKWKLKKAWDCGDHILWQIKCLSYFLFHRNYFAKSCFMATIEIRIHKEKNSHFTFHSEKKRANHEPQKYFYLTLYLINKNQNKLMSSSLVVALDCSGTMKN